MSRDNNLFDNTNVPKNYIYNAIMFHISVLYNSSHKRQQWLSDMGIMLVNLYVLSVSRYCMSI